ncbi:uncharacterized protein LOC132189203 [Corylus avellana]|uniref:uncharacterized protein LOC132189203 n=1 Tax=Corylus avellana TaxID=13451 RepID=UPI00286C9E4D|nr:uncharacterized protein LOC132189203 [Corylus avellana]
MDAWAMGHAKFQKCSFSGQDFRQLLGYLFDRCGQKEIKQFSGMSRRLWLGINDLIHGGTLTDPKVIIAQTKQAIVDFTLVHGHDNATMITRVEQTTASWQAPVMGWAKANCDAALARQHGRMGLGVVIRDSRENMQAAGCVVQNGCLAPAAAEAMVILLAIRLCHELSLSRVHFEGDAKSMIDSVNSVETDNSWMGHIIEDIKLELRAFQQWQPTFIRRKGNQVVHLLAKHVLEYDQELCWRDIP